MSVAAAFRGLSAFRMPAGHGLARLASFPMASAVTAGLSL
jgi:hypothetical protein